jgi:hypothetical protein
MFSSEHGLRLAASAVALAISAGMLLMDPRIVDAPPEKLRVIAAADELSAVNFIKPLLAVAGRARTSSSLLIALLFECPFAPEPSLTMGMTTPP